MSNLNVTKAAHVLAAKAATHSTHQVGFKVVTQVCHNSNLDQPISNKNALFQLL